MTIPRDFNQVDDGVERGEKGRRSHRQTWLIVLIAGGIIIAFFNRSGSITTGTAWWVAVLLSGLMIIYAWTTRSNDHVSVDTRGDGIYYLGLLFTFLSLVVALIAFTGDGGDSSRSTSSIIGNFGIALITTIVGLAGRVWYAMSQESAGDITETAKEALDAAVEHMKDSLGRAADSMAGLVYQLDQSADELGKTTDSVRIASQEAASTAASLGEHSGQVASMMKAVTELSGPLRQTGIQISRFNMDFSALQHSVKNAQRVVETISDTGENAEAMAVASANASRELEKAADQAKGLRQGMEDVRVGFDSIANLGNSALLGVTRATRRTKDGGKWVMGHLRRLRNGDWRRRK